MKLTTIATTGGVVLALAAVTPAAAFARHASDDPIGHVRHARGADDAAGHVREARGADDNTAQNRAGNGVDDRVGHVRHGADDGPNHG